MNHLLERQIAEARGRGGELDLDALLKTVSAHYDRIDGERRGIVRSMQLMSDEAQALTREIREQTASHLQAILDNVKDAIVTVDDAGHIETFNPTGERIFGYAPAEILGRSLEFLLPDIATRKPAIFSSASPPRSTTRTSIWRRIRPGAAPRAAIASRWRSPSARRSSIGATATSSASATSPSGIWPSNRCARARRATARWWSMLPK